MKSSFDGRKPELSYPCEWSYTIFGKDEAAMREAARGLIGHLPYEIEVSNRSSGGKYVSLTIDMTVDSEAQRLAIFMMLSEHEEVRFVL